MEDVGPKETLIVEKPPRRRSVLSGASEIQDVVLYGKLGSSGEFQGVNLNDEGTLSRSDLTSEVIADWTRRTSCSSKVRP